MFSASGARRDPVTKSQTRSRVNQRVLPARTVDSDEAPVPHQGQTSALSRIEDLFESIVDALDSGEELVIPYQNSRTPQNEQKGASSQQSREPFDVIRFPGRTIQEAKRFEAMFRILEMSHQALLSGNIITKRNIYYQNPGLFKSQSFVDVMVDNLASTLGIGREDLNIVAAAKGLISGPINITLRDGSTHCCDAPGDSGMLLPSASLIQRIDFRGVRWVLVVEKEATFRTLAASRYCVASQAGHGVLITAKGFPDLATRRFLSFLQRARPNLALHALVDFDPHGVAIMRTYKYGSKRLGHEENATSSRLRWLGILSDDVLPNGSADSNASSHDSQGHSQETESQDSATYSLDGSQNSFERRIKRARVEVTRGPSDSVLPLTLGDRKKAVDVIKEIVNVEEPGDDEMGQIRELQRMLMLNVKAEIQAVDNFGDLAGWLDEKLIGAGRGQGVSRGWFLLPTDEL
ncbi:Spo11/DNA topoisomerase VI subunit A [Dichotomopilus funicola]|uniref:DNA topoisomerase (ATP-hydrolyzing) n=1 Tax=Dichotomopilus funicola TaxID=1934379 RepID=A0AAN6ZKZ4_9PEZI|nr:Spo11/DNA topoisomerase VI subunit A [Dichotomopilus funicola]